MVRRQGPSLVSVHLTFCASHLLPLSAKKPLLRKASMAGAGSRGGRIGGWLPPTAGCFRLPSFSWRKRCRPARGARLA